MTRPITTETYIQRFTDRVEKKLRRFQSNPGAIAASYRMFIFSGADPMGTNEEKRQQVEALRQLASKLGLNIRTSHKPFSRDRIGKGDEYNITITKPSHHIDESAFSHIEHEPRPVTNEAPVIFTTRHLSKLRSVKPAVPSTVKQR